MERLHCQLLVRNYTDDEAVIIMVDSNIQRENYCQVKKAHAYKMKYDAMKHQGSKGENIQQIWLGKLPGTVGEPYRGISVWRHYQMLCWNMWTIIKFP